MKKCILTIAAGLALAGFAIAAEHPKHPKAKTAAVENQVIEATITGENVCLGCTLKKEHGAAAQCSIYGHSHGLRVIRATVAGKERPEMKGWLLNYLATDKSQPFIKEHDGETLTLKGKVYPEGRVFEVAEQEPAEKSEPPKKAEHPEHPK